MFADEVSAARKYDEVAASVGRPVNFPLEGQTQAKKPAATNGFTLNEESLSPAAPCADSTAFLAIHQPSPEATVAAAVPPQEPGLVNI